MRAILLWSDVGAGLVWLIISGAEVLLVGGLRTGSYRCLG